ncbi:hypothetical protein ACM66B_002870 [Microbotryomycetes sp. NB124-2]
MPFASRLGVGPFCGQPDYFDSLDELARYRPDPVSAGRQQRVDYVAAAPRDRARVIVCHDYKGGYTERHHSRQYTFNHWDLVDTFIYFSHRRISAPPASWIRAAHLHDTGILGTLIFEHDQGKHDLDQLLGSDVTDGEFKTVSTAFADLFVDLAVERGFEGWLVNVEVPFGIRDKGVSPQEHVNAMLTWLAYLRAETARRIPVGGEIMWYDGANETGVKWQNSLTDLNAPFLRACDSILLNYFWRERQIEATKQRVYLEGISPARVLFGIDVHGRGQLGGGGFNSSASAHAVRLPEQMFDGFSLAIFAPAWTEESQHLGLSLTSKDGSAQWRAADEYLWRGGQAPSQLPGERVRLESVQREERGVMRARQLAEALRPGSTFALAPFDYRAPLAPLPGSFRPLADYCPRRRSLPAQKTSFYSTFGLGSGHDFWFQGRRLQFDAPEGWTDVDLASPQPRLLDAQSTEYRASLCEEDAWIGATSLSVESSVGIRIPLFEVNIAVAEEDGLKTKIVWKAIRDDGSAAELLVVAEDGSVSVLAEASTRDLAHGWRETTAELRGPATIRTLCLHLSGETELACLLVGFISLAPISTLRPSLQDLRWSRDGRQVLWTVKRIVTRPKKRSLVPQDYSFFVITADSDKLLATTVESEISVVSRTELAGSLIECCAVCQDGNIERLLLKS